MGLNCGGSVMAIGSNCNHGCLVPAKGTVVTSPSTGGVLTRSLGRHTRGLRGVGGSTRTVTTGLRNISLAVTAGIDSAKAVFNSMDGVRVTRTLTGLNRRVSEGAVIMGSTMGRINSCGTVMGLRGRISMRVPFRMITRWSLRLAGCEGT